MLHEIQKVSGVTPKALLDRPRLEPHLAIYQAIYDRLSRSRQWYEAGPQPISVSEILAYCDGMGLHDLEFRENLIDLIQEMDEEFSAHCAELQKTSDTRAKSDVAG